MKHLFLLFCLGCLLACGSTQKTTGHLASGNYEAAFNTAVAALNKDKSKKINQKNIPLLKEAYDKAATANLSEIKRLSTKTSAENLKKIYGNYLKLDLRQDEVQLLQPLVYEGQEYNFEIKDYTQNISTAKSTYAQFLYDEAQRKLKGSVEDARIAYQYLEDLRYVDPSFKSNLDELATKAKERGSVFIYISIKNNTRIPKDSLSSLRQINANNFSNPWVIFHHTKKPKLQYTKEIQIYLDKLTMETPLIQPETIRQEARIEDGWTYQKDDKGNVMKDEKGNDIKLPVYKTVVAEVVLYSQVRTTLLEGYVTLIDNNTTGRPHPVIGEAKFQNNYGKYRGDQRAIEQKYIEVLQAKEMEFPPEYAFINFSVLNFKRNIEAYLSQQQF